MCTEVLSLVRDCVGGVLGAGDTENLFIHIIVSIFTFVPVKQVKQGGVGCRQRLKETHRTTQFSRRTTHRRRLCVFLFIGADEDSRRHTENLFIHTDDVFNIECLQVAGVLDTCR